MIKDAPRKSNYIKAKEIEEQNKLRFLKLEPRLTERSGIYILYREENGIKFAYVGQAKHLLTRLAQHLSGYQHIDLSLKKHGLWSEENPTGYKVHFLEFSENLLDEMEQKYIKQYANAGYQLRNATAGGQGQGKTGLDNARSTRTYYDGLLQGYKNAQKEVAHLFELHLDYKTKSDKPNKNQQKALQKFKKFLEARNG